LLQLNLIERLKLQASPPEFKAKTMEYAQESGLVSERDDA